MGNDGVTGQVKTTPPPSVLELPALQSEFGPVAAVRNQDGSYVQPTTESISAADAGPAQTLTDDLRVSIVDAPARLLPFSSFTYVLVY
jgi:phosphate transport system substrate-binding protein